jgi:hypothetical protein
MPWLYSQITGELRRHGRLVGRGYSGTGPGRDNPAFEAVAFVGPIPRGQYRFGLPHQSPRTGPHVMDLTPEGHDAFGRDHLQIHGDKRTHDASTGCIVLDLDTRDIISSSSDNLLIVTR